MADDDKLEETLGDDLPQIAAFLRRLEACAPGSVPEGLMAMLEGASVNETALLVLAAAFRKAVPAQVQPHMGRR